MDNPFIGSAKQLIDRVLRRKAPKPAPEPEPSVAEVLTESAPPKHIIERSKERAEIWSLIRIVQVAVVVNLLCTAVIFVTYQIVRNQPTMMMDCPGDLSDEVHRYFTEDVSQIKDAKSLVQNLHIDNIALYVNTVLGLKHGVSPAGSPFLPLLQGVVSKEVYDDAALTIERNLETVKKQSMTQTYVPLTCSLVDIDANTRRLAVTVSGKLAIHAGKMARGGTMVNDVDYRALVVVEIVPKSTLNQYGLFMPTLPKETYGAKACEAYDKELEAKRAKRRGED